MTTDWGELHCVRIVIAPPLEFVGDVAAADQSPRWYLDGSTLEDVERLLHRAELPDDQLRQLLATAEPVPALNGICLSPSPDRILSLGSAARGAIYHRLSQCVSNGPQVNAFRFLGESLPEWIGASGLQPATVELIEPLVYRHGPFLFFADLPLVLPRIRESAERTLLLKALAGEVTMLMRLRVGPWSDIERLVSYWSHGGRNKDFRPILESLARCAGGESLDVVHLLPPFARRLLYTYPRPPRGPGDTLKDCHWTSLNFFNELPDNRFLDLEFVVRTIEQDYYRIYHGAAFGDLVIFCTPHGEVFHSAIHVADEVAFTKQGATTSRPWMLMRIEHLRYFYARSEPVEIRYYRRRSEF
ncbi:MAG: hypothetical protein J5I93_20950 [Pirellulaceae bacterium]|nr:hypothetical protein [Pirellulaceae bacterium]